MGEWKASGAATLVGSMPHKDRVRAIDFILEKVPEIPVWPQLVKYEAEQMMVQFLEGLPGLRKESGQIWVETQGAAFEEELYRFYEDYLAASEDDVFLMDSRFGFGEETGRTFFAFLQALERVDLPYRAVKGQVVGPFTLLSGLKDQDQRALLFDERLQDVVVKHLAMKARWQVNRMKSFGRPVILFLDEPALAGFGSSAFITVTEEQVAQLLREVMDAVHDAEGLAGIHVCANTDWLLAFRSPVDIINFDAYQYFDRFALYRKELAAFLEGGGTVAWGIVPTGNPEWIDSETVDSLCDRWLQEVTTLTGPELPMERIFSRSLFTPSCGCGTLNEREAERVVELTRGVSDRLREKLGFRR